jgi:hypothetical protein
VWRSFLSPFQGWASSWLTQGCILTPHRGLASVCCGWCDMQVLPRLVAYADFGRLVPFLDLPRVVRYAGLPRLVRFKIYRIKSYPQYFSYCSKI